MTIEQKSQNPSRAGQRIREYLDREFARPECHEGVKLPPIAKLARHLDASTSTLYYVFRQLRSEGRLKTKPGDGTYLFGATSTKRKDRLMLGVSFPAPESAHDPLSQFGSLILSSMQRSAMTGDRRMAVIPQPSLLSVEETRAQLLREADFVDGMILSLNASRPHHVGREVLAHYESMGKPCLTLNPFALNQTENFVGGDYYAALLQLGRAWTASGRRRIGILREAKSTATVTSILETTGLQAALDESPHPETPVLQIQSTGISEQDGFLAMKRWLVDQQPPDALFCFGGPLALGALRAFREHGIHAPRDVSLVGGTHGHELREGYAPHTLTSLNQPYEEIGKTVVEKILWRIETGGQSISGQFLPMTFCIGETTNTEENALLA